MDSIVVPAHPGACAPAAGCASPLEHSQRVWALTECLKSGEPGRWFAAGLMVEHDCRGHLLGAWKRMQCGCLFIMEVL